MEKVITESKDIQKTPPAPESPVTEPKKAPAKNEIVVNACVISHRGCVRDNNEDNFFFDGDLMTEAEEDDGAMISISQRRNYHLFAVCDGMGGLQGGERASSICVYTMGMLNMMMPSATVPKAIDIYAEDASKRVYEDSIIIGEEGREGSTMAVLYLVDGKAFVGNVGDSRVYLLRGGQLFQLSEDQSPVFEQLKRGELTREQMRKHPRGTVIGAFIGMPVERWPYAKHFMTPLCEGDRFMLCSDGVSDLLMHEEIRARLAENRDPKAAASLLIWRAMEMGGKDNSTCMVVDVLGEGLPAASAASLAKLPKW